MHQREILEIKEWASAIFSGHRVTVSGPLLSDEIEIQLPNGFVVSVDTNGRGQSEIVILDEGDPVSEDQIRATLLPAIARAEVAP